MKKLFAVLLSCALITGTFAGCGNTDDSESTSGTKTTNSFSSGTVDVSSQTGFVGKWECFRIEANGTVYENEIDGESLRAARIEIFDNNTARLGEYDTFEDVTWEKVSDTEITAKSSIGSEIKLLLKEGILVYQINETASYSFERVAEFSEIEKPTTTTAPAKVFGETPANYTAPKEGEKIAVINIKDYGAVKVKLFPEYADKGVENFIGLAEKGYYDGLIFHRVIKDFMIQGGDPKGNGTGGECLWGSKFDGGTNENLIHTAGALAYANSGSTATNGSQFYIVTGKKYGESDMTSMDAGSANTHGEAAKKIYAEQGGAPWLDGGYTVFGQVFDGLDIVFKIQNVTTGTSDKPATDVVIESVKIEEYSGEELKWYLSDYNS